MPNPPVKEGTPHIVVLPEQETEVEGLGPVEVTQDGHVIIRDGMRGIPIILSNDPSQSECTYVRDGDAPRAKADESSALGRLTRTPLAGPYTWPT